MGADGEGGAGVDDGRGAFEVGAGAPRRKAGSAAPAYVTAAASTCIIIIIIIIISTTKKAMAVAQEALRRISHMLYGRRSSETVLAN